ncbi:hypothetical protein [Streptococcus ruminantium]|uniref:hypothetical protein n=1 Tax=Streptococcus ruminantium TaxID=1917441 RepID=UPI0012DBEFC8|nr:hypothetical protein [Streptococcus ruminantium]
MEIASYIFATIIALLIGFATKFFSDNKKGKRVLIESIFLSSFLWALWFGIDVVMVLLNRTRVPELSLTKEVQFANIVNFLIVFTPIYSDKSLRAFGYDWLMKVKLFRKWMLDSKPSPVKVSTSAAFSVSLVILLLLGFMGVSLKPSDYFTADTKATFEYRVPKEIILVRSEGEWKAAGSLDEGISIDSKNGTITFPNQSDIRYDAIESDTSLKLIDNQVELNTGDTERVVINYKRVQTLRVLISKGTVFETDYIDTNDVINNGPITFDNSGEPTYAMPSQSKFYLAEGTKLYLAENDFIINYYKGDRRSTIQYYPSKSTIKLNSRLSFTLTDSSQVALSEMDKNWESLLSSLLVLEVILFCIVIKNFCLLLRKPI